MTSVKTNVASLNAQYNLNNINRDLEGVMTRLSTGKRINSAGDDAAGGHEEEGPTPHRETAPNRLEPELQRNSPEPDRNRIVRGPDRTGTESWSGPGRTGTES